MYAMPAEELDDRVIRYRPELDGVRLTHGGFLHLLASSPDFRRELSIVLQSAPFAAVRWETPGVSAETAHRDFEFVLVDDPTLERDPEPEPFSAHFRDNVPVVAFDNQGGDAHLIVPCPRAEPEHYVHLAAFLRGAPRDQVDALLERIGTLSLERFRVDPSAVWLSTAGGGVAWLHVRLDERPKYFHHAPYRKVP